MISPVIPGSSVQDLSLLPNSTSTSSDNVVALCGNTVTVMSNSDSGAGSLRQALLDVCPGGTITFDNSLSGATILLTSGTLQIPRNLTIDGANLASHVRVSGNNAFTVFSIPTSYVVSISGLTIVNGYGSNGGGINNYYGNLTVTNVVFDANQATTYGGGIYNYYGSLVVSSSTFSNSNASIGGGIMVINAPLTISNSSFMNNAATNWGAGIFYDAAGSAISITNTTFTNNSANANGGGLYKYNAASASVTNSVFSGNRASGGYGGGINNYMGGPLTVTNNTFSGNTAGAPGGGIYNGGSTLALTNNTFSANSAPSGGGIYNANLLNFSNNIITNSTAGGDCVNAGGIGTVGINLIRNGNCPVTTTADPLLGVLGSYGGPTQTLPLLPGSPAIDGTNSSCPAADQRGIPRGGTCDLGAFESRGFTLTKTGGDNQSTADQHGVHGSTLVEHNK